MSSEVNHIVGVADSSPSTPSIRPAFRNKLYVYMKDDEAAFSKVLLSHYPSACFMSEAFGVGNPSQPPVVALYRNLAECPRERCHVIFPDKGWVPRFQWSGDSWILVNRLWPNFLLHRYTEPFRPLNDLGKAGVRYIKASQISAACYPGDKAQLAFAARIFRLLRHKSVASQNVGSVNFPDLTVNRPVKPGSWRVLGFGHHAMAWARERPDRLLAYEAYGGGYQFAYRPLD